MDSFGRLGVIGGSSVKVDRGESSLEVNTPYGMVKGLQFLDDDKSIVFIPRHMCSLFDAHGDPIWAPPHAINYRAFIWALKAKLNVVAVIALSSVGSLDPDKLPVGSVVTAMDFVQVSPSSQLSFWGSEGIGPFEGPFGRVHYAPPTSGDKALKLAVEKCIEKDVKFTCKDCIYVETPGPRFETKAEILRYKNLGNVLGMTCGKEWVLCGELNLPYMVVSTVDNLCNGLGGCDVVEEYSAGRKVSAGVMDRVVLAVVGGRSELLSDCEDLGDD